MGLPVNALDNAATYLGTHTNPDRNVPVDPPDGTRINGRLAEPDEVDVIRAAREQERARCAVMVSGVGRGRLTTALT